MTWVDLGFPEDYFVLPLDLEPFDPGLDSLLEAAVEARLAGDDPQLEGPAETLVPTLRAFHHEAWDFGAMATGVLVVDIPGTRYVASVRTWLEDDGLGAAAVTAKLSKRVKALAGALAERRPGDLTSREVRVVDLPAGPAVRVSYQADDAGGQTSPSEMALALEVLEHWFLLPDLARAFVLQGRTANVTHRDELAADVDRIAQSVRLEP